jgi:hypothetical protein
MRIQDSRGNEASSTDANVTEDVGSEGGSPGDVEIVADEQPTTGSEAGEISRPTTGQPREVVRDETGEGRRSP